MRSPGMMSDLSIDLERRRLEGKGQGNWAEGSQSVGPMTTTISIEHCSHVPTLPALVRLVLPTFQSQQILGGKGQDAQI
ncbi:hypothetical protein Scep_007115 [Stephania cephalantha]|uniref:Uncharacterized protein n=1 Tax=Stephania cephalantha TaxID=152367 RepID=A0AAP0PKR9_9MAGN